MKGWYGQRQQHMMASRGINTANGLRDDIKRRELNIELKRSESIKTLMDENGFRLLTGTFNKAKDTDLIKDIYTIGEYNGQKITASALSLLVYLVKSEQYTLSDFGITYIDVGRTYREGDFVDVFDMKYKTKTIVIKLENGNLIEIGDKKYKFLMADSYRKSRADFFYNDAIKELKYITPFGEVFNFKD